MRRIEEMEKSNQASKIIPSAEQQAIIDSKENTMVVSNPGTGKTTTLALKVIDLLENEVNPEEILCLTFTAKAKKERRRERGIERANQSSIFNVFGASRRIPGRKQSRVVKRGGTRQKSRFHWLFGTRRPDAEIIARRQEKARRHKTRQGKTREDKKRQDWTTQGKARQGKRRQHKTRQDKTREDKTRE